MKKLTPEELLNEGTIGFAKLMEKMGASTSGSEAIKTPPEVFQPTGEEIYGGTPPKSGKHGTRTKPNKKSSMKGQPYTKGANGR